MRKFKFQTGEFYHIYNRGVDRCCIFINDADYLRFLRCMRELNDSIVYGGIDKKSQLNKNSDIRGLTSPGEVKPLVEFACYSLMPNHYHFLLKLIADDGIIKFMQKLGTAYTMYFNLKYYRTGSLFQGTYKASHVETDSYFLRLSGYINGNAEIHKLAKAEEWMWSSYQDFLGLRNGNICNKNIILNNFTSIEEYEKLTNLIINESTTIKTELKKYLFEV